MSLGKSKEEDDDIDEQDLEEVLYLINSNFFNLFEFLHLNIFI